MQFAPKTYQFLVGVFASLGSLLFGYDLGVIAEVVGSTNYESMFKPNAAQTGAVVSVFTGGAFVGAMLAGPSGDWIGRRGTMLAGSLIFLLGGGLQTGAQSLNFLWAGRCLAGVGVGFLVMIIPPYQAEIAHPDIRGRITALQQFMLGIGSFVAGWVSWGTFISLTNSSQWRIPLGLQMLPAVFLATLIYLFPESPRWLIHKDRHDEALKTLARLHTNGNVDDPWLRAEFDQIRESVAEEKAHEAKSYVELFKNPSSFRRLFIACALQASIQMTGVSAIQYYSIQIYGQIGINSADALKYQAINNILALIAQASCIVFVDHLGRRGPLIWGNICNGITFIIATILITQFPPDTTNNAGASWGFIIMTWLYNISFSATCGPLSWIIPAEIFDTHTRSKGVSIATMTSFAFNTLIGQVTPIAMTNIRWRYYVVFCVCNFTNALFFWAVLPETKKLPLEEMNYLFTNSPWLVGGKDQRAWRADYLADIERRAAEIQEKGGIVDNHNEQV